MSTTNNPKDAGQHKTKETTPTIHLKGRIFYRIIMSKVSSCSQPSQPPPLCHCVVRMQQSVQCPSIRGGLGITNA